MIATLLILGAIPWLLILMYQISRRGFAALLIWLLLAPALTQAIDQGRRTVLFRTAGTDSGLTEKNYYGEAPADITLSEAADPTRAFFALLLATLILNVLIKKTPWVPLNRTEIWMGIFSLLLLASALLLSGRIGFGLRVAVDAFIVPFLGYFFTRRFVTTEDRFHKLIRVLGYLGIFVILMSLYDRLVHDELFYRVRGPFSRHYSLYIAMVVVFFSAFMNLFSKDLSDTKRTLPRSIVWLLVALAPVVIMLTMTRGNWVGFLTGLAVFFFFGRRLANFSTQVGTAGSVSIVFVLFVFSVVSFAPSNFIEGRVSNVGNIEGRFATWIAVLRLAQDAPIIGIGLNNLQGELGRSEVVIGEAANYTTAHNSFLALLAELGAVGTIIYLLIQASIIKIGFRLYRRGRRLNDRWRGMAVVAIMVSYHVASMFEHIIYHTTLAHVYVYLFAGAIAGLYPAGKLARVPRLSFGRDWRTGTKISTVSSR